MSSIMKDKRLQWTVHTKIEKFNTKESYEKRLKDTSAAPDEVVEIPGNMLLNDGVNLLWSLVAGDSSKGNPFNAANSFIGVGDNNGTTTQPTAGDVGLAAATKKMYMKMDDGYPIAGENQKIVFRSTFLPGVACFEWLEWTIANGNGNQTTGPWDSDVVRTTAVGDDPIPDPVPTEGVAYSYGVGEANIVNLNRKQENMGKKYSSATWIVTCEISLS